MTPDLGQPPHASAEANEATVVAFGERPVLGSEWVVSGRLRLRREIQTSTRSVEVTVRREVLTIDYDNAFEPDVNGQLAPLEVAGEPPADRDPVSIVLHEEIPQLTTQSVPYEIVTAHVMRAVTQQTVGTQLTREQIVVETTRDDRTQAGPDHLIARSEDR